MKPSINSHLHFHPGEGVTHAAIVTAVHTDTCVSLAVFDSNGGTYSRTSVQLVEPGQPKPEFGYFCEWMPDQVERSRAPVPSPVPAAASMTFAVSKATADAMERIIQKIDEKIAAED